MFTRSGTTWTHRQTLTASESADLDAFGWAVSLSRDTVLVSMSGKRSSQGVVFVFTRSENFWTQQAMLTASDGAGRDVFGSRLSLDGDTAAIVSTQTLFIPGAVYLFNRSGTTWTQQQKLTDFDSTGDLAPPRLPRCSSASGADCMCSNLRSSIRLEDPPPIWSQ